MNTTRILGIDPGLSRTGFAVIEVDQDNPTRTPSIIDAGVFKLDSKQSVAVRLTELEHDLAAMLALHKPAHAAVEALYAHQDYPRTAIIMAHARGVVLLCLQRSQIPTSELPANTVKKSVAGHGHASKEQVASSVASILALDVPPSPFDVSDALAIAICASTRLLSGVPE